MGFGGHSTMSWLQWRLFTFRGAEPKPFLLPWLTSRSSAMASTTRANRELAAPAAMPTAAGYDDAPHASPLARLHDIEVAVRVDPDPVTGAHARNRPVAPARQPLAVEGQDADPAAIVLGDVDGVVIVDVEERRADQFGRPDGQQFAVLVEYLPGGRFRGRPLGPGRAGRSKRRAAD